MGLTVSISINPSNNNVMLPLEVNEKNLLDVDDAIPGGIAYNQILA